MVDTGAANQIGQNYQDWWDFFRGSGAGQRVGALNQAAIDWLNRSGTDLANRMRTAARGAGVPGVPPPSTGSAGIAAVPSAGIAQAGPTPDAVSGAGGEGALRPPATDAQPAPSGPKSTLDQLRAFLTDTERAIAEAEKQAAAGDYGAQQALPALRTARLNAITQIAQEENRVRDDAKKAETEKSQPKNGDTRTIRVTTKDSQGRTVNGTATETYNNGTWSYVAGSAKADTGFLAGPEGPGTSQSVLTDGQGTYWTYNPSTGKAEPLTGPKAGAKTLTDPDGSVYLQNPDGTPGQRLFEGLPQTYTDPDGYVVLVDKRTGQLINRVDTKTPEGRALADRLAAARVAQAEKEQYGTATAQYTAEVARRQGLARTELARLQDLQKQGQLSPDQAEAQFDTWMKTNVEGPLAGLKAAAEEERRKQEQENLTRQTAEENRVDALNRERQQLGYNAGEAARARAWEVGSQTRAPEFLRDMGGLAQRLAAGPMGGPGAAPAFQFSPESFDPARYKAVLPDYEGEADKAMQRLFGVIPQATARNVNVPLPNLPTGADLRTLMDGVRYTGPLTGTPNEEPLPGQAAVDLGTGMARTSYPGGRYIDWRIGA